MERKLYLTMTEQWLRNEIIIGKWKLDDIRDYLHYHIEIQYLRSCYYNLFEYYNNHKLEYYIGEE